MSEQLSLLLKKRLADLGPYDGIDVETRRNVLKEELQFHILNFIYHHPEYSTWIMYGGSALRIIHGLNRMSVDLDFEISQAVTEKFLQKLKKEIEDYFMNTYSAAADFLTVKITSRGLLLKFHMSDELGFRDSSHLVHVKIDLNHFVAPKTVTERRPINRDQLSFVILTYNMGTLMASKIAAIFLRGSRGVGKVRYNEKGRDIYDLLWYMEKSPDGNHIVPDFDYLAAKNIDVKDLRALFDKLTLKMNDVSDANLKQDLSPLFVNRTFIENWLRNWRESYLRLLEDYKIRTVTTLETLLIREDFLKDVFSFIYQYNTEEGKTAYIIYSLHKYWITDANLEIPVDEKIKNLAEFIRMGISSRSVQKDTLLQYATLFHQKTENYLKKTNRVMLGDNLVTKVIRMTSDKLNQKEEIVLNVSTLKSCELDDLLK
ncbi:MAG: hypothetical protein A3F54_03640 [Candidatus Kerfeldbacteria bacterium RIFCSPHIGHO2_12_FULL_48_17]|uniref:Protein containing DUF1814 n=1 Tax=Candidatus Kerfeldbacteria bacterium RIFCSPHIGHO2_12_FULL_48_17 TaxID=1798542 RepID=A0A1G2B1B6_9BACT|nr:MAG: hypothetical protein A3F54_03640 [Candidatus Kerfeldbacteria bacterium RIFCSPHIGHO2_12_FULL_48_17]